MAVETGRARRVVPGARLVRWWVGLGTWRQVGVGVFAVQFVAMAAFSQVQASRGALTHDFAVYWQAFFLIAHGHMDPYSTVMGMPFVDNHFEIYFWAISWLYYLWPHPVILLWIQDLGAAGMSLTAYLWSLDFIERSAGAWKRWLGPITAAVITALNPWLYMGIAFDYHNEAVAGFFIILCALMLYRQNWKAAFALAAATALCGDLSTTYVIGLGMSAVVVGRSWRRPGFALLLLGACWLVVIEALGAGKGSTLASSYGYLAQSSLNTISLRAIAIGTLAHPARALAHLWSVRLNLYANLVVPGLIGLFSPWGFGVSAFVLASSALTHYTLFSLPGMQNIPAYGFLASGTVWRLSLWCNGPARRVATVVAAAVCVNTVAWAAVWLPRVPDQWLLVSPGAGVVLKQADRTAPLTATVIASQGVDGILSGRPYDVTMAGGTQYEARTSPTIALVSPFQGIELASPNQELARIAYLAAAPGWRLVSYGSGVWEFERSSAGAVSLPASAPVVPAWALRTQDGAPIIGGPVSTWHMAGGQTPGYVVDGAYWREPPGRYRVKVRLATSGPVNVEVWNATGSALLRRWVAGPTKGIVAVGGILADTYVYAHNTFSGFGPFVYSPILPPPGDNLEVRVWSPGGEVVNVYSVGLSKA